MKPIIEYLSAFRDIRVSEADAKALVVYWNGVQALRPAADQMEPSDEPTAVAFDATKVCRRE